MPRPASAAAPEPPAGPGRLDPAGVLAKVMTVLRAFDPDDHGLMFGDLQARTGLPKATLHRVLADLVTSGLLDREQPMGGYVLGRYLFELGMRASVERTLLEVATPFLEDLYERTHETVHLGVREGREVVYVAKMGGHRQAATPSRLGGRMPLHATAIGKALLAYAPAELRSEILGARLHRCAPSTITAPGLLAKQLAAVVESGVSFEFEESAVGVVCVGSPILDPLGHAVAAVSVAGPALRFEPRRHAASVHAAAAGIAATLARRQALLPPS